MLASASVLVACSNGDPGPTGPEAQSSVPASSAASAPTSTSTATTVEEELVAARDAAVAAIEDAAALQVMHTQNARIADAINKVRGDGTVDTERGLARLQVLAGRTDDFDARVPLLAPALESDVQNQQVFVIDGTDAYVTVEDDPRWAGAWLRLEPGAPGFAGTIEAELVSTRHFVDAVLEVARLEHESAGEQHGQLFLGVPVELALQLAPARLRTLLEEYDVPESALPDLVSGYVSPGALRPTLRLGVDLSTVLVAAAAHDAALTELDGVTLLVELAISPETEIDAIVVPDPSQVVTEIG